MIVEKDPIIALEQFLDILSCQLKNNPYTTSN